MTDPAGESVSLMCSGCRQPCTGPDAHVIPAWNTTMGAVVTTYRCTGCLPFCDFLARRGYGRDAETIREAEGELQQTYLLRLVDAVEDGRLVLEP